MKTFLLQYLRCPACGGNLSPSVADKFADEIEYGLLTCYCGQYPVVAGIPIFKKGAIGNSGQSCDDVNALIKGGKHRQALFSMIIRKPEDSVLLPNWIQSLPSIKGIRRFKRLAYERALSRWREQAEAFLASPSDHLTAYDLFDFYFRRSGMKPTTIFEYFAYRFGQPRQLVALSFLTLIHQPKKPILELASGCGHITHSLLQRAGSQPVIGVDEFFFGLYVAKYWVAPGAEYVCCDVNRSLPFSDDDFSACFCVDAFHYFLNKMSCFRELKRLTGDDGIIALIWVHNAGVWMPRDPFALPPEGYQALVGDMPHYLGADSDVLSRYLQKQGPSLALSGNIERLVHEPSFSVVATYQKEIFQDHGHFNTWPHAEGYLGLNPLYVEKERDGSGNVRLRRMFPSTRYEESHSECKAYLPETIKVPLHVLTDLADRKRTPEIERLISFR